MYLIKILKWGIYERIIYRKFSNKSVYTSYTNYFISRIITKKEGGRIFPTASQITVGDSLFCGAYQALLHIARDVLRIEGKLVGVEILARCPTNAVPELVAHLVVVEGHKRRLADVLISQGLQAEAHHLLA